MSLRTANIEVSLQRLSILRIEHPQANPLKLACTLRAGETLPSGLVITAEIHTSRNVAAETAPLASSSVTVAADATSFEVLFDSPQTNQTVTPDSTRPLWLVMYGVGDSDQLYTLAAADLLLGWHAISTLTADPPATSILIEKGGVAWASGRTYVSGTMVTVGTTAYVASSAHTSGSTTQPGTGASWATVWAVLSGGGGTVNLTPSRTANAVTITPSGGGTAAEIPQANSSNAGVITNTQHNAIEALSTMSTQSAASVAITGGTITGTTVSGVTLTNGGSGALTVTGVASVSGTNTGDQTISLTGDVTGSGTGSVAATIASGVVTNAKLAEVAPSTFKGNPTTGTTQNPVDMTPAQATAILPVFTSSLKGLAPSSGGGTVNFLRADATFAQAVVAGSVDKAVLRASGTGGATTQGSAIVIDEIEPGTQQNVAIRNVDPAANSAFVITPKGTGAFILGPKPDGTTAGGVARGARAIDLQTSRSNPSFVASGADSFTTGVSNRSTGATSGCLSGDSNQATGVRSVTIGGFSNGANGTDSVSIGGQFSFATASNSAVMGLHAIANRIGQFSRANGRFSTSGDAQRGTIVMRRQTTDATPVPLSLDGAAPTGATITTSTHFLLLNNQAVFADIRVVARSTSGTDHAAFMRRVLIKRDANAASTAIIGTVLSPTADIESAGATAWEVAITADTTNGGLLITVTGAASTTINWVASVDFVETIRA